MSAWAVGTDLYSRFGDEFVDKLAIRRKWNNALNDYVADESQVGKDAVIDLALNDAKAMILQKLSCYYSSTSALDSYDFPVIKQWHILLTIETLKRGGQCYGCECIAPMEEYFKCGTICSTTGVCLPSKKTFIDTSTPVDNCTPCGGESFFLTSSCGCSQACPPGPAGEDGEPGPGVPTGGTAGQILAKASSTDFDTQWVNGGGGGPVVWGGITGTLSSQVDLKSALDAKQEDITSNFNEVIYNNAGSIEGFPNFIRNNSGGIGLNAQMAPSGINSYTSIHSFDSQVNPSVNSPDQNYSLVFNQFNIDSLGSGFDLGDFQLIANQIYHHGKSDVDQLTLIGNSLSLGNGTDPFSTNSINYNNCYGQIQSGVTINGSFQGYGFSPNVNSGAVFGASSYVQAFYDNAQIQVQTRGYQSFNASPTINSIANNSYFSAMNINPTVTTFNGNAGFSGLNISGNMGTFGTGGYSGVNINPNITMVNNANGIYVNMNSVNIYAGVKSSVTIQDIKYEAISAGTDGNAFSIEYTGGGTAGSEVVSNLGQAITVQIESGVSTATQIKTAVESYLQFSLNLTATIVGVASNPQTTVSQTSLTGGINPGTKYAGFFEGNVHINGNLSFTGGLEIGKLNAFYSQAIVAGSGNPSTIHGLVSNPTIAANTTVALGDTIGVNTAMLLSMGNNSHVTTGLVGLSALALPAVVTMGAGSTVDTVAGATFALSLDATATGGTIDNLNLCRGVAIPNGITTVNNLYGFKFDLPFGDPGTNTWAFYDSAGKNSYLAGQLLIGGTVGSYDKPFNSSVGLELKSTTKAVLLSRLTTAERDALTGVDGMILYNSTTNKVQARSSGSWVDLH